ncbi:MAG TPA: ROK family protein [Candidatus Solibacter sp.]|jgi:glucokinase|nr:ROK family protein [Candidatus Solibacter sp.]
MTNAIMNGQVFIGVDVGGTKIAAGLVDSEGTILSQVRTPMVGESAASGLAAVLTAIDAARAGVGAASPNSISGIGICAPGPLDPRTGVIVNPPNLPCWRNFPLADEIEKARGVRPIIDNDGNAAALAEARWGAGRRYRNVFYATIGTGIGTGIIFDGQIYHGRTGGAAEGGHMSIDYRGPRCGCGKPGCIEILAAGPAIARRARAKLASWNGPSALLDLAAGKIDAVSSEMVGKANEAGDPVAREVLRETIQLLTLWLGNIIDLLEPDVLIVGGGVAAMLQPFFDEAREFMPGCCVNSRCQEIPLLMARYGADAGIAGGAALCSTVPPASNHG